MRLRLTLYGFASLLLLAVYAPAQVLGSVLFELRERLISVSNSGFFGL
jgi:hypothetical protein